MGVIDEVLTANEDYARKFSKGNLPAPPARKLAVVACMDARLEIPEMLGAELGDLHIIRNAGGIATEDALRSLIISHYLLGTKEFMIINHTDCGMMSFQDADLVARLERETGTPVVAPNHFYAFRDVRENVRREVRKVKSHPWMPNSVPVRGFVYDVRSGRLTEVNA